jgi:hypothetical protein
MHRVDAESAIGACTPFDPAVAADGVDELLLGFGARPYQTAVSEPRDVLFRAADAGREWRVRISPDQVGVVDPDAGAPDCTVDATASDVFLLLWNRVGADDLTVTGDASLLTVWRDAIRIRWSD